MVFEGDVLFIDRLLDFIDCYSPILQEGISHCHDNFFGRVDLYRKVSLANVAWASEVCDKSCGRCPDVDRCIFATSRCVDQKSVSPV